MKKMRYMTVEEEKKFRQIASKYGVSVTSYHLTSLESCPSDKKKVGKVDTKAKSARKSSAA